MKNLNLLLALLLLISACKKDNPCEGVVCQNGGVCNNGKCECEGLWTGEDCSAKGIPNGITMTTFTLTKMPTTDTNGAGWDLTSGADLYIIIKVNGVEQVNTSSTPRTNASVGEVWTEGVIVKPGEPVDISLYDYDDFDADDFMGGVVGQVYDVNNGGYPDAIQFDCGTCKVGFRFSNITYY